MIVLALDTTTRGGSCALADDGAVLRELAGDASLDQASRLPRDLMRLLAQAGRSLTDVDVFAVATGPGSFTGLRVGIATMQGLAFAAAKPLVGVSAFDALAAIASGQQAPGHAHAGGSGDEGRDRAIATWIDAWRGEVFAALYDDGREIEPPVVAHPVDLLARRIGSPTLVIGDGAVTFRDVILHTPGGWALIAEPASPPLAGTLAALATARARAGELPPPHAIRPLYVRRSDAELARMAKDARASR